MAESLTGDGAERQKERWDAVMRRWWAAGKLDGHWRAKVNWENRWFRVGKKGKIRNVPDDGPGGNVAYVDIQWQYRTFEIHVSLPALAELDDSEVEAYVVHELVHVFLREVTENPAESSGPNPHEEHCVTQLTNFLLCVRDAAAGGALPRFASPDERYLG